MSEVLSLRSAEIETAKIAEFLDNPLRERIINPLSDNLSIYKLESLVQSWRSGDWPVTVAMTSGGYDLMHRDHAGYLVNTKAEAAAYHYDKHYSDLANGRLWSELDQDTKQQWWQEFMYSGELRLIVSVDGDAALSARKGNNPEKGNGTRPVLSWITRSAMVAALTGRMIDNRYSPIVDVVTMHDPVALAGTEHASLYELAAVLKPDVWSIYAESQDIIDYLPTDERLKGIEVFCITDEDNYFCDPLLGGKFSTTKIVNRIKG